MNKRKVFYACLSSIVSNANDRDIVLTKCTNSSRVIVECKAVKFACCALNRMDPTIDYDIAEIK